MGETTGIAWTDHTLNAWIGCSKVSAGCTNCYAEHSPPTRTARHRGLELWGPKAARQETKGWESNVRAWYRKAVRDGVVRRVFVQSLSDTFEDREDLAPIRARLFAMMTECDPLIGAPALHFQLLTKRPENILRMVPPSWLVTGAPPGSRLGWPAHVWIGCTVEDQERAEQRIPHLLRVPAAVRFLSVEPQIGPVDLTDLVQRDGPGEHHYSALDCDVAPEDDGDWNGATISWVIQGGESGPRARPFDLAWARSLRDQCKAAGVAYFLKQLGARPIESRPRMLGVDDVRLRDSHGGDESEWPADLRGCRAFPEAS